MNIGVQLWTRLCSRRVCHEQRNVGKSVNVYCNLSNVSSAEEQAQAQAKTA